MTHKAYLLPEQAPDSVIGLTLLTTKELKPWLRTQTERIQATIEAAAFKAKPGTYILLHDAQGGVQQVVAGVESAAPLDFWGAGFLPMTLPEGAYRLDNALSDTRLKNACIAWGLGAYQFTQYKKALRQPAQLILPEQPWVAEVQAIVSAIADVRDLINLPAEDLQPEDLALFAKRLSKRHKARFSEIVGDKLLKHGFHAIHAVGRAAASAPRLIDIRWGDKRHPKVTLVGKGVCFDSGGLDLKPGPYMRLMKKDMGGAAHVLGLADMIMQLQLPICLRVLVPAVENAIDGLAFRPGDVIKTRKGTTLEVGDTDAEGRVILADALDEAARDQPDLIIDFATLTGSARVALGEVVPVFFCNNAELTRTLMQISEAACDPIWPLPLYQPYRETLKSAIADLCSVSSSRYGDAIMAALLLEHFVQRDNDSEGDMLDGSEQPDAGETAPDWIHFDFMGWNYKTSSGRPEGGEAMALRMMLQFLQQRYS